MPHPRTIAVVTGTRAELGLLAPVMRAIDAHPRLRLRVIAAGLHLTTGTWRDIAPAAQHPIDARVLMQRPRTTGRAADVQAVARGVAGFGKAFATLRPDVVLVLGDRIEAFAAASAASIAGLRVAHVHGGDRAEGVADEAMRHAITKLAHLHYPATAQSRRRLLRMGEHADRVIRVGSPAVDDLLLHQRRRPRRPVHLLVMQHPVGAPAADEYRWMRQTLAATTGPTLVFDPNADPGSDGIQRAIDQAIPSRNRQGGRHRRFTNHRHLPRAAFLQQLHNSIAIVGNSSAGLIEAAVLRIPCVNVGPRQAGRERPGNVIDCDYGQANVQRAIQQATQLTLNRLRHPYGKGDAPQRIAHHLAAVNLNHIPPQKQNAY